MIFIKFLVVATIFFGITSQASAGISVDWLKYFTNKIGKTGADVVYEVMEENGLILSRLKNHYAAFSLGQDRLSEEERSIISPVDVSKFDFIVGYKVCQRPGGFFDNVIYELNYHYHTDNAQKLMEEILEIRNYIDILLGPEKFPMESTSTAKESRTSYFVDIGSIKYLTLETVLSSRKHYIEINVIADHICNNSN